MSNRSATIALGKEHSVVSPGEERPQPISSSYSETQSNVFVVDKIEEFSSTSTASELTTSQMAKQFNVTLRAPRFYGHEARKRLKMILLGKELGFSLAEIKETIGNANADDSIGFEQLLLDQQ